MDQPKIAIVTGAGSGIGRSVCELLAERGYSVVLVGRRREPLVETAECMDGDSLVVPADMGTEAGVETVLASTLEGFGRIDAIVNNAAVAQLSPLAEHTWDQLDRMCRVNTIGPAALVARAWGAIAQRHASTGEITRVVNVSSMATADPFPGLSGYAATKGGVNVLTRAIANEGESVGIRAFAVAPGAVETAMLRDMFTEADLPRSGTLDPEEVASVIVACAAGERDEENGSVIFIPSPR